MNKKTEHPARPLDSGPVRRVLIVLPAYNEAESLPNLPGRFEENAAAIGEHRIVVVDDGSSDLTASIADSASRAQPVDLIRHPVNQGLGAALKTGLLAALERSDVVITMDADDSHDPSTIPAMIERLNEGFDIVIASRFQRGGEEVGVSAHRRLLSHSASAILRAVGGVRGARDFSCGFRAYRSSFLRRLVREVGERNLVRETGFACMVELLLKASAHGARVAEVPLVLRYDRKRSASKIRVFRTMSRYGVVLAAHMGTGRRWRRRWDPKARPVRQPGVG